MNKLFSVTLILTALSLGGCQALDEAVSVLTDDGGRDDREEQGEPITVDGRTYLTTDVYEDRDENYVGEYRYVLAYIEVHVRGRRVRCTDNEDCIQAVREAIQRMEEGDEM